MQEQLHTVQDIAAQSKSSDQTIRKLCADGVLPAVKIGRKWLIPDSKWHEYLDGGADD